MKKLSIALLFITLTGCGSVTQISSYMFPAKYDSNEYELVNRIRTIAELSMQSCDDTSLSKNNMNILHKETLEFKNYTQYQQRNQDTFNLASNLYSIADGNIQLYNNNDNVSQPFCELSLTQINETAEAIQKVLGDKPR